MMMVGQSPDSLRRPACASIGLPFGSNVLYSSESFSQMPVPGGMVRLANGAPGVCVLDTTLPSRPATAKCVVCPPELAEAPGGTNGLAFPGSIAAACCFQYGCESSNESGGGATSGSPA